MEERRNVPKLRFPGFTDPWEQRRLGELGSVVMCKRIYKDQTTERGDVPFFKIGTFGGEPDAFISNELFEKYQELYSFPKVGDILISAAGTIGRTTVYQGERAYFQDSNIVWLDHDDRLDNGFLLQYLNDQTWSSLEGSTLKRLYNKDILDARIALPALDEQQCVGSFFAKLDSLIALHQRELDHVKELKKGLLQKMFPKEGTNVPELRFPGFTDPWEQRRFGELALLRRGLTYTPDDVVDAQQGTRVLRSSNINEDRFELSNDDVFVREDAVNIDLVRNNDILITAANGSSRLVGKRALIKGLTDSAVHGGFMLLASTEEPDFFNAVMGTEWYRRFLRMGVAGGNGALGNLDSNALRNRDLLVPKRAEQKAIGALFQKLDSLIALHQRELDHVKELKKGLLQQMFV